MSAKQILSVAVVGCGYWGKHYVRITNTLNTTKCVYVCDTFQPALDKIASQYPSVKVTTSFEVVCSSPDVNAVIVAVPATKHYEVARQVLLSGKHLLIEKPFTTSEAEGKELQQLARDKQLTILVGHTFIYNDRVKKMKETICAGTIGDIHTIYAQRTNLGPIRHDTSAIWDLAPHDLSIFLYLLDGQPPVAVSATGHSVLQTTEHFDVAFVTLFFANNIVGHIHVSWLDPQKVRTFNLVGSKGRLAFNDMNSTEPLRIYHKGVEGREKLYSDGTQRDFTFRDGDIVSPVVPNSEPLTAQVCDFVNCCISNTAPQSGADMGIAITKILLAIEKSCKLGGQKIDLCA